MPPFPTMKTFSAEFLLIDIGNTRVKLHLASPQMLVHGQRTLSTANLLSSQGPGRLRRALAGWNYERVVLASVVPAATKAVARLLDRPILQVTPRLDIGVDLRGYPGRSTLGADRLADMAAAWALYGPGPMIVVDLGTAAVFNVIDAHGVFLGGVIAPGLAAMHGNLRARTAQLPRVKPGAPMRALGGTTQEALLAGGIYAYRGMIREILAALRSEVGPGRLVGTGGDGHLFEEHKTNDDVVCPELTLEGLRVIGVRSGR
jgi:type III pantothenate kinase